MYIPCDKIFLMIPSFPPSELDLEVWTTSEKINLGYNFQTRNDTAFILHMYIPCDNNFYMVPQCLPCDLVEVWPTFEKL